MRRGGINAGAYRAGHPTISMKTSPGSDFFWESKCAEHLGISRTRIRELRKAHLAPEVDWQFRDNAVVLTTAGLDKISQVLAAAAVPAPSASPTPANPAPVGIETAPVGERPANEARGVVAVPSGPPASQRFMVVRIPPYRKDSPQRKILICRSCPAELAAVSSWAIAQIVLKLGEVERPVRVRDNINFTPGMVIDAVSIGYGQWQYVGRLPRRPGRW